MERKWVQLVTFSLSALALLCWAVMFLTAHDVWHDLGKPDIANLQGPPYNDLRVFATAFYLLLAVLAVHVILTGWGLVTARRGSQQRA